MMFMLKIEQSETIKEEELKLMIIGIIGGEYEGV